MNITFNGKRMECGQGETVAGLVKPFEKAGARFAVLVNGEPVPRGKRASRLLREGDKVELLTFAGGG